MCYLKRFLSPKSKLEFEKKTPANGDIKPFAGVFLLVRLEGLEPPTYWFVANPSIQLSYNRRPEVYFIVFRGRQW